MVTVLHPAAVTEGGRLPGRVAIERTHYAVDGDTGTVELDSERQAERLAEAHGVARSALTPKRGESETEPAASELIERGECPWCDAYDGDHVGQHASSAHPESWDAYKGID